METLSQNAPPAGTRVLFVRPGGGHPDQLFAMDHFALEAARSGMAVGVLGPLPSHPDADRLTWLGPFPAFRLRTAGSLVARLQSFQRAVRDFRPDIVHVRNHLGGGVIPLLRAGRFPGTKVVLDIRTLATSARKHRLARMLRRFNGRGYDHVFALNQSILDAYIPEGVPTSLLPLGFDDQMFQPGPDHGRYRPGQRLRCIYYGSMNRVRGLETLIRGLLQALQAGVDLEADLLGEGDDMERLASLVPSVYRDRIQFHGLTDQQSLARQLRSYHLGLAYVPQKPVFDPNLPLKTVEMLGAGLPVLATGTGGNREVIREGRDGLLVGDSPESIREGLERVACGDPVIEADPGARAEGVKAYGWGGLSRRFLLPVYADLVDT